MEADGRRPPSVLRKPEWLKVPLPGGSMFSRVRGILAEQRLHSVCQEARCPNIAECFRSGTATFLILGNTCTRTCRYCNISCGTPRPVDRTEPDRLAAAAAQLNLSYIVITSVTRDDLPDGGSAHFASCIDRIRIAMPRSRIEVLIPDFGGHPAALERILQAGPDVINHNVEVVPSLFPILRPQGDYGRSLSLLHQARQGGRIVTKSGFMVGFGETPEDIRDLLHDLLRVDCRRITVGQYQQPTAAHWPVKKYLSPDEFAAIGTLARSLGFERVESGPLVRSSYHAAG